MAGTKAGAAKTKKTILETYGKDYYKEIGKIGGKLGTTGGFAYALKNYDETDPRHPSNAGKKGGKVSKRGKRTIKTLEGVKLHYEDIRDDNKPDFSGGVATVSKFAHKTKRLVFGGRRVV